ERGATLPEIKEVLGATSQQSNVRVLLLDQDLQVAYDSDKQLEGKYVLSFENNPRLVDSAGSHYRWTNFDGNGARLTLFSAPAAMPTGTFEAPPYEAIVAIPESELASAWLELVPRLALAGAIALAVSFIV